MKTKKSMALSYLVILFASALYAVTFNWFYAANDIAYGGLTGIAMMINHIFGMPSIGLLVFLMNVPLFLLGWRLLGGKLLISSLVSMSLCSLFIDVLESIYTFKPMEPLLACIYGGVLLGVSLGLIFLQGATTGGTDIGARLLKRKLNWLPLGKLMLSIDLVVICSCAVAFQSVNSSLYGIVSLYISSIVLDGILYGMNTARMAYIISDKYEELSHAINQDLARGVTILHGEGAWSRQEKRVLLCAFKRQQIVTLKRMIKEIDPNAFLIVCKANEVLGDGFQSMNRNDEINI